MGLSTRRSPTVFARKGALIERRSTGSRRGLVKEKSFNETLRRGKNRQKTRFLTKNTRFLTIFQIFKYFCLFPDNILDVKVFKKHLYVILLIFYERIHILEY